MERNLELDVGVVGGDGGDDLQETSLGGTWVFWRRLQLGVELPYDVVLPEQGRARAGLSDVGFSTQVLLCCDERLGWRFVSLRGEVAAPTGNLRRGTGGNGAFGFSLLAGNGFTTREDWEDLGVQVQLGYAQEIAPDDDERDAARFSGMPNVREKDLVFNVAFTQPLFGRRLTPVVEILGTSVLDAVDPGAEGIRVELGVGFWAAPFADASPLSAASFALGWRWPVTDRRESRGAALAIFEWAFD